MPLDYETWQTHGLTVRGVGFAGQSAGATVLIFLSDVNDNAPVFNQSSYSGSVPENTPLGVFILQVSATDADSSANAVVVYSLLVESTEFVLDPHSGILTTRSSLDFEAANSYRLTVIARDMGTPSLNTSVQVTVNVVDENDVRPSFSESVLSVQISETRNVGSSVIQLQAVDPDTQNLTYSLIEGNNDRKFEINTRTGLISLASRLDFELRPFHSLVVVVSDGVASLPPSNVTIDVTVLDENDNSPMFSEDPYVVSLPEDTAPGTAILTVFANDTDSTSNALIFYSISHTHPIFVVEPTTGVISTTSELDFEDRSSYQIQVVATDQGDPPLSSSTQVFLVISDVNDNPPVFTRNNISVILPENQQNGSRIALLEATDADSGFNSMLQYRLEEASNTPFQLNMSSGLISLFGTLDYEAETQYLLQVVASDLGSPSLSATAFLTVEVLDQNDNAPEFSQDQYSVFISEMLAEGSSVLLVNATDRDSSENAALNYFITAGNVNSAFLINNQSGLITLANSLDFELTPTYTLSVTAVNLQASNQLASTVTVSIQVLDVNEFVPSFPQDLYQQGVLENQPAGLSILSVAAVDQDQGPSGQVVYEITAGNERMAFDILSNGTIVTLLMLDREQQPEGYNLVITASDRGIPSFSSTTRVLVNVLDLNDSPPLFLISTPYTATLPENVIAGTDISLTPPLRVRDDDDPATSNANITFRIASGNTEGVFDINARTGQIQTIGSIDFELISRYELTVVAADGGIPSLSSSATVVIDILDSNDNPPQVSGASAQVLFSEGQDRLLVFPNISITDADSLPLSLVRVTLTSPSMLSGQLGILSIGSSPPSITVSVQDNGRIILLTGSFSPQQVTDLMRTLVYANLDAEPDPATRSITVVIADGDFQTTHLTRIMVELINDNAPVLDLDVSSPSRNFSVIFLEEGPAVNITEGAAVTDDDGMGEGIASVHILLVDARDDGLEGLMVDSLPDQLHVQYQNNSQMLVFTASPPVPFETIQALLPAIRYFNTADEPSLPPSRAIYVTVSDGELSSVPAVSLVNIIFSDDPPVIRPVNSFVNFIEGGGPVMLSPLLTLSDSDSVELVNATVTLLDAADGINEMLILNVSSHPSLSISSSPHGIEILGPASPSDFITVLRSISYNNVLQSPASLLRRATFAVSDGISVSLATAFISFDLVNDPPLLDLNGSPPGTDISLPFLEGSAAVAVTSSELALNDVDSPLIDHAIVHLTSSPDSMVEGIFVSATVGSDVTITASSTLLEIRGPAVISSFASILTSVMYFNTAQEPTEGERAVLFVVNDGELNSTVVSSTITVRNVNDAPVLVLNNGSVFETTYTEESSPVSIVDSTLGITLSDSDNTTFSSLSVSLRNVLDGTAEILGYADPSPDSSLVVQSTAGMEPYSRTVQFQFSETSSGISVFQNLIFSLSYSSIAPEPTAGTRDISIAISDGIASAFQQSRLDIVLLNDNAPVFQRFVYQGRVLENVADVIVATVTATDADSSVGLYSNQGTVLYQILSGNDNDTFQIDTSSGEITVQTPRDRESSTVNPVLSVQAFNPVPLSNPSATYPVTFVVITVADVNDNSPQFVGAPFLYQVTEHAQLGTVVGRVLAVDADAGSNAELEYTISQGNPNSVFSLDRNLGEIRVANSSLLDRERMRTVLLSITATDGGSPHTSNTTTVTIHLTDINDNIPVFSRTSYAQSVSESAPVNTSVLMVSAVDMDDGVNGRIVYTLNGSESFDIGSESGVIRTLALLDHETRSQYLLTVVATDQGQPSLSQSAQVVITLEDVNDHTPVFQQSSYSSSISEGTPVGQLVDTVMAFDDDTGSNAAVTFSILEAVPFSIDRQSGAVITSASLDRETQDTYNFTVIASDAGSPQRQSSVLFTITLLDANDNIPVFVEAPYVVELSENVPLLSSLVTVEALDNDEGTNAEITYSFVETTNLFQVDSSTGEVFTVGPIDFEQQSLYSLELVASDAGQPPLSSVTTLVINVTDANDNTPVFDAAQYQFTVAENQVAGIIGSVFARDEDSDTNADIVYSIPDEDIAGVVFSIDGTSGDIRLITSVDREMASSYSFSVVAADMGVPQLSSTSAVSVRVEDRNDNPPIFTQAPYFVSVLESVSVGSALLTVNATDADIGSNGVITYRLASTSSSTLFSLDEVSGQLTLVRPLDAESAASHILQVHASDAGSPVQSSSTTITITVGDVNDVPIQIIPATTAISYLEESSPVTLAPDLSVTDGDAVASVVSARVELTGDDTCCHELVLATGSETMFSNVTLELVNSSVLMLYGPTTPAIATQVLRSVLYVNTDPEPQSASLLARFSVSDGLFSDQLDVMIQVRTINDNAPVVTLAGSSLNFSTVFTENSPSISAVGSVIIADADSGQSTLQSISVALINGVDSSMESLSANSVGLVSVFPPEGHMLLLNGPAPIQDFVASLASLRYVNTADDPQSPPQRVIEITASDGLLQSEVSFSTIDILAINDPPTLVLGNFTAVFLEGEQEVRLSDSSAMLSDPDSPHIQSASIVILNAVDPGREYLLISPLNGVDVTRLSEGELRLAGPLPFNTLLSALRTVTYLNNASAPSAGIREVAFTVSDGDASATASAFVQVELINDPPSVDLNGPSLIGTNYTTPFTEGGPAVHIASSEATISDSDSVTLRSLSVTILQPLDGSSEVLMQSSQVANITSSFSNGMLLLSGEADIAVYTAVLRNVAYLNTADQPSGTFRQLEIVASDDRLLSSEPVLTTLQFNLINDPPVVLLDEGSDYFSVYQENSAAISIVNDRSASVSDPDSSTLAYMTVSVTNLLDGDSEMLNFTDPTESLLVVMSAQSLDGQMVVYNFSFPELTAITIFNQLLLSLEYINRAEEPNATLPRVVSVLVSDGELTSQPVTSTITIRLIDDNEPLFTNSEFVFNISEDAKRGAVVGYVVANDLDVGDTFLYQLSATDAPLLLDSITGELTVNGELDREIQDQYMLSVQLTRTSSPFSAFDDQAMVVVNVQDVNDNSPIFNQSHFELRVSENTAPGTVVAMLEAVDIDAGTNAALTYTSEGTDMFMIGRQTGNLLTVGNLNRELIQSYEFTVTVMDGGLPMLSSEATVAVAILDVNDEVPQFQQASYFTQVVENIPVGTTLVQLSANDADSGLNAEVRFALSPVNLQFSLDQVSGVILSAATLSPGTYNFTATAQDRGTPQLSSSAAVTIIVISFNSTLPVFSQPLYEASISENSPEGVSVVTVMAVDPVTGEPVSYSLLSPTTFFSINSSTGLITTSVSSLDREMRDFYQFQVMATSLDGARVGVTSVSIRILDANDFAPVFLQSSYTFRVVENNEPGSGVGAVLAMDNQDTGDNANIILYRTSDANFSIDSFGVISASVAFDREAVDVYTFPVVAVDGGIPAMSSSVQVTVSVLDANDQPPVFSQSTYLGSVAENQPGGTSVLVVRAEDADVGSNAIVSYSTNSTVFSIDAQSGVVSTLHEIDYDTLQVFQFLVHIVATDGFLSSTATAIITVQDVDDTPPMFSMAVYSTSASEEQIHTSILQVVATDNDSLPNNTISLLITGGDSEGNFTISPTGVLSVVRPLDREALSRHTLTIQASNLDAEGLTLSSEAMVMVEVLDLNDNTPQFLGVPYSVSISEAATTGTPLLTLEATDEDSATNANIGGFRIVGGDMERRFSLGPQSGVLQLSNTSTGVLDREVTDRYELTVEVSDNGSPPLVSEVNISITVLDVNDERPTFSQTSYTLNVPENTSIATTVFSVGAEVSDADLDSNAEVTFSFLEQDAAFSVSADGAVLVASSLDFESQRSYSIVLLAVDGGIPALTGSTLLNINVLDEDDQPVEFILDNFAASVFENSQLGTIVLAVRASDPDTVQGNPITYSLQQTSDTPLPFSVDSQSGDISVAGSLDREIIPRYMFTVLASNTPGFSASATVLVDILDVNDMLPEFDGIPLRFQLSESVLPGYVISDIAASDGDTGSSGEVALYNLEGAPPNFMIDPLNGTLSLVSELDFEVVQTYMFNVTATDGGSPSLTGQASIRIDVTDANDNAPEFSMSTYQVVVSENLPSGGLIFRAVSDDADSGLNGEVRFSLAQPSSEFSIEAESGEIRMLSQLFVQIYSLIIVASDMGSPSLSSTASLVVQVTDGNERPVFSQDSYSANIPEDRALSSLVIQVIASDPDSGVNAELSYSIDPQDQFSVDASSGRVTVSQLLDFETQQIYTVNVYATDNGIPSLNTSATLTVTVIDTNDNSPIFDEASYNTTFPEDTSVNTVVLRVSATDADSTSNAAITYSLMQDSSSGSISINSLNGSIFLIEPLDYETLQEVRLVVQARDGGAPFRTASVPVTLTITDVDDNGIVFSQSTPYLASASEAHRSGASVVRVEASDADEGTNAVIHYSLVNSTLLPFAINILTGDVIVSSPGLDREQVDQYSLVTEATNPFSPLFTATAVILITVLDSNDNRPVFDPSTLQATTAESSLVGSIIGRVLATDADTENNSVITYSFDPVSPFVSVDGMSGEIRIESALDFELRSVLDLTMVATDSGIPSLSIAANYRITVLNVNDETPVLTSTPFQFTYEEEAVPVGIGGSIAVSDADMLPLVSANVKLFLGQVNSPPPLDDFIQVDLSQSGSLGLSVMATPTCINITGVAPAGSYMSVLRGLEFGSTASELVSTPRLVQVEVFDGNFISSPLILTVAIQSINDNNPVLDLSSIREGLNYETDFTEGDPFISITDDVSLRDMDSDTIQSITVNLTNSIDAREELRSHALGGPVQVVRRGNEFLQLLGPASATDFELALRDIVYMNLAAEPSDPQRARVVTFVASDGELESPVATTIITIIPVNDAPIIRLGGVASEDVMLEYSEAESSLAPIPDSLSISDVDNEELSFVNITVTNFRSVEDRLIISTNGYNITAQSLSGTLLLTGPASIEDFSSVLQTLLYVNLLVNTDQFDQLQGRKSIQVSVSDGSLTSRIATASITFSSINDPPVLDLNGPLPGLTFAANFVEGDGAVNITSPFLTVIDVDSTSLLSATVTLSNVQDSTDETLAVVHSSSEITSSYNTSTNQLTILGPSSIFNFEATLRSLMYTNSDPNPTPGLRTAAVVVSDGEDVSLPVPATITVLSLNDPPQIVLDEDGSDFIEGGGAVRLVAMGSARVLDVDNQTLARLSVRLENAQDGERESISVFGDVEGLRVTSSDLSGARDFVFSFLPASLGTLQQFSLILEQLTYSNVALEPVSGIRYANITVSDGFLSSNTVSIPISVELINDNAPVFTNQIVEISLPEDWRPQTAVFQATASDSDTDSVVTYSLNPADLFTISETSGEVTLLGVLDREMVDYYNLTITASDGVAAAVMTLGIEVTDVNDNVPIFTQSTFTANLDENVPLMTSVLTLVASDADQGTNAELSFSIRAGNIQRVFTINSTSGELFTFAPPDFELGESHSLSVLVEDLGTPQLSSSAFVIISVNNLNDNAPTFSSDQETIILAEDTQPLSILYTVQAMDADGNTQLAYSLVNGSSELFAIDSGTGEVFLVGSLDYELDTEHILDVEASDGQLVSMFTLTVRVSDVDDNPPMFVQDVYSVSIPEDTSIGTNILAGMPALIVRDPDVGANAVVQFLLHSGNALNQFALNTLSTSTTQLILAGGLDRETTEDYTLVLVAQNPTNPSHNDTALISIRVTDINDSPPEFDRMVYNFSVPENTAIGTSIGQVSSTDADSGVNSQVEYTILSGISSSQFNITASGDIYVTSEMLDFEMVMQYTLRVQAMDGGIPSLSAITIVIVYVQDINDNPPLFTNVEIRTDLMENAPASTTVAMLRAVDMDQGLNGVVCYFVHPENATYFNVDPTSGLLTTTNTSFDFESDPVELRVIVIARDRGSPQLSSSAQVIITLLDQNEFAPAFALDSTLLQVSESVPPMTVVADLDATDDDSGSAGVIEYALVGSLSSPFSIDNVTGEIFTTTTLDREVLSAYMLTVRAFNPLASPSLSTPIVLTIALLDFNDNIPTFTQTAYMATITTSLQVGDAILTVTAQDDDIGSNGNILYTITNTNGQFNVSASTGIVFLASELTTTAIFNFLVMATDQGDSPLSSSITVTINVIQPFQLTFNQRGAGFLLNQSSATSQDLGFFVDTPAGAGGSVSATLGSVTVSAPYTTHLVQATSVRGVVLSEEVWHDVPEVSVVVQVSDELGDVHCSPTQVVITILPDVSLRMLINLNPQVSLYCWALEAWLSALPSIGLSIGVVQVLDCHACRYSSEQCYGLCLVGNWFIVFS